MELGFSLIRGKQPFQGGDLMRQPTKRCQVSNPAPVESQEKDNVFQDELRLWSSLEISHLTLWVNEALNLIILVFRKHCNSRSP